MGNVRFVIPTRETTVEFFVLEDTCNSRECRTTNNFSISRSMCKTPLMAPYLPKPLPADWFVKTGIHESIKKPAIDSKHRRLHV
ncbi:hypothetical protein TNCV_4932431 [Trichonephila clavipes]|nr:hypothetical protein TNCV_4932431 [Trichonephila clavipes]